jgi:hypothetical protein
MYQDTAKAKPHWIMSRHLNNERKEWKTVHVKGRALMEEW